MSRSIQFTGLVTTWCQSKISTDIAGTLEAVGVIDRAAECQSCSGSDAATGAPARFAPRYCFADIVAVDSDIITLLGPDGAAAVLHGSPRERRDGFLRAYADPRRRRTPPTSTSWPPCRAKCYTPSCEGDRDERTPR